MLEFLVIGFSEKDFPTNSRHSNRNNLCPSPNWHTFIKFKQYQLSTGQKPIASQFHITIFSLMIQTLRITWLRYPIEIEIKKPWRATCVLPSWIYPCRSGGTVFFTLTFMANMGISIFILQTFRSLLNYIYTIACFFLTADRICQGFLLLWMFYSGGYGTYQQASQTEIY